MKRDKRRKLRRRKIRRFIGNTMTAVGMIVAIYAALMFESSVGKPMWPYLMATAAGGIIAVISCEAR